MSSSVRICSSAGTRTVPMGRTAHIDVVFDGLPETAFGYVLLPFVNGRRWGAHELVSTERTIALHLPLPDPGPAFVEVVLLASDTEHWMGLSDPSLLMVGQRMPAYGVHSNVLHLEVVWRDLPARKPSETLFCMQWEPWFTTGIAHWRTAQSVPMVGFYDSFNADVTRQHILWFIDLGVDFIMPDWSNHIWGCDHWDERSSGVNMILHATELALEVLATMRDEGLPVPKVALMPGLSNGPPAKMGALNEELAWVYHTYLRNPRFAGLWQELEGKPLVVVLDTGAVAHPDGVAASAFEIPFFQQTLGMSDDELDAFRAEQPPVDDTHFTVRWMSSQNQTTRHHELGYWSWMDGVADPPVTYRDGEAEAVTVTPSFFNAQGWTGPLARGRRGGATYLETFRQALAHRPKVVLLHQFNEFTGQQEGQGYGPNNSIYVDTYSVELSDDLEPVSLTAPSYRGDGGWGFTYLNLTQALMALYRDGAEAVGTLLAVSQPLRGATVRGPSLAVAWSVLGKPVEAFTVSLDGQVVGEHVEGTVFELSLSDVAPGSHAVTVTAKGAMTRYPLSQTELDEPLSAPIPVRVTVPFRVD